MNEVESSRSRAAGGCGTWPGAGPGAGARPGPPGGTVCIVPQPASIVTARAPTRALDLTDESVPGQRHERVSLDRAQDRRLLPRVQELDAVALVIERVERLPAILF